jgi:UDP-N-acetyl-D-galactosamine dehydrogenase
MKRKLAVVGLGYVGLPVAVEFGKKYSIVGFDINERRIKELMDGYDFNHEVAREELTKAKIEFTSNPSKLSQCNFIIIAVPTPITENNQPDLTPLIKASETVGRNISKGTIIVYESTVYPGATEEVCIPVLEKVSGLKCNYDFYVGYSPERINPGDKEHTFSNIKKVVSAQNEDVLKIIAEVYEDVVKAGVYKASSIKVAEASKVIENTQRDINIALMNELSLIFDRIGIDTEEVIRAAETKWNFIPFRPGLVGGHCISVDPYYLTYKAEQIGIYPQLILAGRRINNEMGRFVAHSLIKRMIQKNMPINGAEVIVLGLTFKENISDLRNSKVIDIIQELEEFGVKVQVSDVFADKKEAKEKYHINLIDYENLSPADAVILAVPHQKYVNDGWKQFDKLLKNGKGIVVDLKSKLNKQNCPENITLWRL